MSKLIRKEHNVSVIIYHIVCSAKYRRAVINSEVDKKLKEVCEGIEARYEIKYPAAEQRGIEDFALKSLRMRGNKSPAPPVLRPRGAGY
jgi:hypothetical protein